MGADKSKIIEAIKSFACQGEQARVFGDGKASQKIAEVIGSINLIIDTRNATKGIDKQGKIIKL